MKTLTRQELEEQDRREEEKRRELTRNSERMSSVPLGEMAHSSYHFCKDMFSGCLGDLASTNPELYKFAVQGAEKYKRRQAEAVAGQSMGNG